MERPNAWKTYNEAQLAELEAISKKYRTYLDNGKTERECVTESVRQAKEAGFVNLDDVLKEGKQLKAGDRVYCNWMNKCFMAWVIGENDIERGMNILGAHIDSPRIDVKQNPLFENGGFAKWPDQIPKPLRRRQSPARFQTRARPGWAP